MPEVPDLSSARAAIEALMIDRVRVTNDAYGVDDATFNDTTGQYDQAVPTVLYEGKGKVRPSNQAEREQIEGGSPNTVMKYIVGIPISAPAIPIGAYVEVLTSVRDTSLVGRKMLVTAAPGNTMAIQRKLMVEEAKAVERVRP